MLNLKQPLNYGGRLFEIGENVRGKLPLDLIQELQENGHLEEYEDEKPEDEGDALREDETEASPDDPKIQRGSKRG